MSAPKKTATKTPAKKTAPTPKATKAKAPAAKPAAPKTKEKQQPKAEAPVEVVKVETAKPVVVEVEQPAPKAKKTPSRKVIQQAEIIAESFAAQGIRGPSIQSIVEDLEAGKPVATPTPVETAPAEQPKKKGRDNSKFQRTLRGKSTYTCGACGKLTRETGHGEDSCDLCAFCYHEAGLENSLSDGNITQAEFDAEHAALVAKYKKAPKQPRVTVASRARELVTEGLSNEDIFAKLQAEFGIGDNKKHYPAWYRAQMKRKAGA